MRDEEKVLSVRKYKAGYEVRTVSVKYDGCKAFVAKRAYTPEGDYIGSPKLAHSLIVKKGIKPQMRRGQTKICSIGFCEKEQKWYGWSHRALFGFGLGDRIYEDAYGDDDTSFAEHGRFEILTLADAKLAASRFARSVN